MILFSPILCEVSVGYYVDVQKWAESYIMCNRDWVKAIIWTRAGRKKGEKTHIGKSHNQKTKPSHTEKNREETDKVISDNFYHC